MVDILVFRLSPCCWCRVLSSGYFHGVWIKWISLVRFSSRQMELIPGSEMSTNLIQTPGNTQKIRLYNGGHVENSMNFSRANSHVKMWRFADVSGTDSVPTFKVLLVVWFYQSISKCARKNWRRFLPYKCFGIKYPPVLPCFIRENLKKLECSEVTSVSVSKSLAAVS
jgi:hypothetical protein